MFGSIPIVRVKRFTPEFERAHHLGPKSRPAARARIETDAALTRSRQIEQQLVRAVEKAVGQ